jgi:hypothetical protein
MKIAYLTPEQCDQVYNQYNTEYTLFCVMQDDETFQYYITQRDIDITNVFEFLWVKDLELVNLPEYERYKFKLNEI